MALTEKARETATENENNRGQSGSYDGIDLTGEEAQVQVQPGAFVTGVVPEDEGNPIIRFNPYDDDAAEVNAGGNIGVVLDDPEVIVSADEGTEDTLILHNDDEDTYWDYRVYNTDRKGVNFEEGIGVEFDAGQGSRLYKGEVVDKIAEDRMLLTVSGGGAVSVAKALDVLGDRSALYDYDDEYPGPSNGGLIEYPLYDDDNNRVDIDGEEVDHSFRYARRPQLREELYGKRVGVLMDWWTNSVIYEELDDDGQDRYDAITEGDQNDSYYYTVFDIDAGEVLQPQDDGEYHSSFLLWRYDPNGEDGSDYLDDDQYEFVTGYVDEKDDFSEEAIRETVEENADNFDSEPNTDEIVRRIQDMADS
jgi:hypothetical protein